MSHKSVFVEQFVDEGLGNSAYLVGSRDSKMAVLIDPLRDVDRYLAAAEKYGVRVCVALDTHLHADFVSGAREVAARTSAVIGASASAGLAFHHRPLTDGDHIWLGDVTLQVCATPGHSPEHISFLLTDTITKIPDAVFSGGALIVGGAARTDLLGDELAEPLAHQLFHTFHDKLLCLPDEIVVYPTHGAGSFCVAPVSAERVTTIGNERRTNPLAQLNNKREFVRQALSGLPSYPVYYKEMRPVNRQGVAVLGGLPAIRPLTPVELAKAIDQGAAVLDTRAGHLFCESHIPDAFSIPFSQSLGTWVGWLIPFGTPLALICNNPFERDQIVRQLIRIGYDNILGELAGGLEAWQDAGLPTAQAARMTVRDLKKRLDEGRPDSPLVLDVRHKNEWQTGHIPGAIHIENGRLPYVELSLPADRLIAVVCSSGFRSMAAMSVLRRRGYQNVVQVDGGVTAWAISRFAIER